MAHDKFYSKLIDSTGEIECGKVGDRAIIQWDGINPILISQQFIEACDWGDPDIERLPNKKFRIGHYTFEYVNAYPEYDVVAFNEVPMAEDEVPQSYWDRLAEWKAYQGIAQDDFKSE